jgi:LytS/YehU family sensor histidine kinase
MHIDVEKADRMVAKLSDLLRYALDNTDEHVIPLRDEINFLKRYLEIEQTRFGDRLTVTMDIPEDTWDARVPNLILQPIVENAMKHAVVNSRSGHVEISAAPRNGAVHIEVKDNGPGLQVDRTLEARRGKGLGLANTQARLVGLYGTDARFEMTNRPSGGLVVSIEIPRYQRS